MDKIKVLLVEDNQTQINLFERESRNKNILLTSAKSIEEAFYMLLKDSFDAVILDLKFPQDSSEECSGNKILDIVVHNKRCFLVIYSATPEDADDDILSKVENSPLVKKYSRGSILPKDILKEIEQIYNSGITKFFGSNSKLENMYHEIFWSKSNDILNSVISGNSTLEELNQYFGILLEHIIVNEASKNNDLKLHGDLIYLPSDEIATGCIIKKENKYYFVITPACDIAQESVMYLHLLEMIPWNEFILRKKYAKKDAEGNYILDDNGEYDIKSKKKSVVEKIKSNPNGYQGDYYPLPKGSKFDTHKFIDFYNVITIPFSEKEELEVKCQVMSRVTKDIVNKYASIFSRQGSPDFLLEKN